MNLIWIFLFTFVACGQDGQNNTIDIDLAAELMTKYAYTQRAFIHDLIQSVWFGDCDFKCENKGRIVSNEFLKVLLIFISIFFL